MNKKVINELINLVLICIGGILLVTGVNLFLKPADVYSTGLFGFSQELSTIFFGDTNYVNLFFWIINIPLIIFGFFKEGKKFLLRTIFSVISISIAEVFIHTNTPLIEDKLLAVVTGSIIMGIGTGLALSRGGSTGGADIIATYISIIKGKSFGIVNILINSIVIVIAILLTQNLEIGIYMLISIYIGGILIDHIHNYNQKMTLFIVTDHKDDVVSHITSNFLRGVTVLDSTGGYSKKANNVIMITVSKPELENIVACVKDADPNAFVNIYKVQRLLGTFNDNYVEML